MNILHLTHSDSRSDNRILKELGALADTGLYNITCIGISSNNGASQSCHKLDAKIISLRLITNLPKWVSRPIRHFLMLTEFYIRLLREGIKVKPNIIHCHDTMVLPVGLIIKIITKAKLIYDAHELESNRNGQTKMLAKVTFFIEKKCWSKIDHFITVSNSIISWYEKEFGVKSNSLILNSPLIRKFNSVPNNYFHNLYSISTDKLVFVYLGILSSGRGIDYILDAFSQGTIESHIVFIGYGEMGSKIKEFSLKYSNIHLHDAVPHEEIVATVKNADVGLCLIENVSLSDFYCLPNKLFEYIFAGLPVLASNFPEISNLVKEHHLGNVCDVNFKSIHAEVSKMEKNHPERIASNLSELGWEKQSEKLRKAYMKLQNH